MVVTNDAPAFVLLGIAALERTDDVLAHEHFTRATELDPASPQAWFWRAKTAETLDEVIDSLTNASELQPENELVSGNLELAIQRREAQREAEKAAKAKSRSSEPTRYRAPGPATGRRASAAGTGTAGRASAVATGTAGRASAAGNRTGFPAIAPATAILALAGRTATAIVGLVRQLIALATAACGVVLVLSALPAPIRDAVGFQAPLAFDPALMTSMVHVPVQGGYDLGLAIPYVVGFLAVFLGLGTMGRNPSPRARNARFP
jgi:hypothetical protein